MNGSNVGDNDIIREINLIQIGDNTSSDHIRNLFGFRHDVHNGSILVVYNLIQGRDINPFNAGNELQERFSVLP